MEQRREEQQKPPLRLQLKPLDRLESVHVWKVRSVYEDESTGTCYHLHPELVDVPKMNSETEDTPTAFICEDCSGHIQKEKCPPLSLLNGVDFGDPARLDLPMPNDMERHMIAKVRLYIKVLKVNDTKKSSATRKCISGHAIAFNQNSPEVVANDLFLDQKCLNKSIKICLVGPDGELDRLAKNVLDNPNIMGRGYVLHSWLSVLVAIENYHYNGIPSLPSLSEMNEICAKVNKDLINSADRVTDEAMISHDDALGDDVAKVRAS